MKKWLPGVLLALAFLIGLSLLLYPTFSDYWNRLHQSRAIESYIEEVAGIDESVYDQMWAEAKEYNKRLESRMNPYVLSEEQKEEYPELLNVRDTGAMGYIEIPSIDCYLPIYHGTSEGVLQTAVGHLEWTSLPTGGVSTHAVFSGHRGLPSAKLFTNLDKVVVGDVFILRILNETLTYEVDQILTVEPEDTEALLIRKGRDYVTLVTCTPYGINTHRLLVRGHRIENIAVSKTIRVTADAMMVEEVIVAPILSIPLLIVALVWLFLADRRRRKFRGEDDEEIWDQI